MKPLALTLCLVMFSACGPKQYHTAVVANTSLAQAIFAVQDAEIAAHNAKLITDERHAAYKADILKLLEAGDALTLALKDWQPSQPVPQNVVLAIGRVQGLLNDLELNSPQATALLSTVQTVLSVLRGSGVLPSGAGLPMLSHVNQIVFIGVDLGQPNASIAHRFDLDGPVVAPLERVQHLSRDGHFHGDVFALESIERSKRNERSGENFHAQILQQEAA